MKFPIRLPLKAWVIVMLLAVGLLIWNNRIRLLHDEYVSGIAEWSVDELKPDANEASGYLHGVRHLIVPDHHNPSYQWIAQTQLMLAGGDWRMRKVEYDNSPYGRESHGSLVYHGWLAGVAWGDHIFTGRALGLAVEHSAKFANPILQLLLLVSASIFTARWFGGFPAAIVAVGVAGLFPFACEFLPGAPDHRGLAMAIVSWGLLLLLAGVKVCRGDNLPKRERRAETLFLSAGISAGIGLWVSVSIQGPVLIGVFLGGLLAAVLDRWDRTDVARELQMALPWRIWALGGAVISLVAYMVEYYPADMALRLKVNHPVHAIAWLAGAELLRYFSIRMLQPNRGWSIREVCTAVLAMLVLVAVLVTMYRADDLGIFSLGPLDSQLAHLGGIEAASLSAWVFRDGVTFAWLATCLPFLVVVLALWKLCKRTGGTHQRTLMAVALGPVIIAFCLACLRLSWWNQLDVALLGVMVVVTMWSGPVPTVLYWQRLGFAALTLFPGFIQNVRLVSAEAERALSEGDVAALIERDFSHWLALRSGGTAVVLASPDFTASLCFHGGLRGLGTLDWENKAGLTAAVRIAAATSPDESLALMQQRGVTHIVLPSWDTSLKDFARMGSSMPANSFVAALERHVMLPWLRPIPYHLPKIAGFENQSVAVFEVVDEQEESTLVGRQAEYFVEMGRLEEATKMIPGLQRFPADLSAMVALAQVQAARGDADGFAKIFKPLLNYTQGGAGQSLAWDRRIALAGVLALGNRLDLARDQVARCLTEINEAKLRALSSGTLFRLLALGRKFQLEIAKPELRELARELLPPGSRSRLQL